MRIYTKKKVLPRLELGLPGSEPGVLTNYTIEPLGINIHQRGSRPYPYLYARHPITTNNIIRQRETSTVHQSVSLGMHRVQGCCRAL